MAVDNQEEVVNQPEVSDDTEQSTVPEQSSEVDVKGIEAKIAELEAQLAKQQEIVDKARKGEKYQKQKVETEVKKVQALYEQEKARADSLEKKIRGATEDQSIRQALAEAGARAVDTALKLVDRSAIKWTDDGQIELESVSAVVAALKTSDSILFEPAVVKPAAPPAKRATESDAISGEMAEIRAAKTQEELMAVLRKYGKA